MLTPAIGMIIEGLKERNGRPGCLQGEQADYLQSLADIIAKKDRAFAANRTALKQRIEQGNP